MVGEPIKKVKRKKEKEKEKLCFHCAPHGESGSPFHILRFSDESVWFVTVIIFLPVVLHFANRKPLSCWQDWQMHALASVHGICPTKLVW